MGHHTILRVKHESLAISSMTCEIDHPWRELEVIGHDGQIFARVFVRIITCIAPGSDKPNIASGVQVGQATKQLDYLVGFPERGKCFIFLSDVRPSSGWRVENVSWFYIQESGKEFVKLCDSGYDCLATVRRRLFQPVIWRQLHCFIVCWGEERKKFQALNLDRE